MLAVPCAGTAPDLLSQMQSLDAVSDNLGRYPTIVPCEPKRSFARPCRVHWDIWNTLRDQSKGIEFDLIYAPRCWELLIEQYGSSESRSSSRYCLDSTVLKDAWPGCGVIYYHCGGVEGNESQVLRYNKLLKNKAR